MPELRENTGYTGSFGQWLKQRRSALGLTQQDMAVCVKCSEDTIRKLEAGSRRPSGQIAKLLAKCLNIPARDRAAFVEFARTADVGLSKDSGEAASGQNTLSASSEKDKPNGRLGRSVLTNLPADVTSFIGRDEAINEASSLLRRPEVRLLTFTGPGGVGKTRLALQVAAELLGNFEDGVFFVSLAPIDDPDLVTSSIAQTLNIREVSDQPLLDILKDYLRGKHMLLLLDNFEQVMEATPLVSELLSVAPHFKVMVTSREVLHLYSERDFRVQPLELPGVESQMPIENLIQFEAIRLFVERAQAVRADFVVITENAQAVVEICRRLDGLPLAIELAAARVRILTPQAMLAKLTNRLDLLRGGAKDLPSRHQTLRNTIDWSYSFLEVGEKQLFERLAVFVGGCALEAIEAVCNARNDLELDVLDGIEYLIDKSLLQQASGVGSEPRFRMLEIIHEYAKEQLVNRRESDELHRQHANYFLELVEKAEPHLVGSQQDKWLARLAEEHDNIRAALRWAKDNGEVQIGLRLAGALWWFWFTHGYLTEGRRWLDHLLTRSDSSNTPVFAKALYVGGNLAFHQGDYTSAHSWYEQCLSISRELGENRSIANSLNGLGFLAGTKGDYKLKQSLHKQSLEVFRELADEWGIATTLRYLADVEAFLGGYKSTRSLYEESLMIFRRLGDRYGIARVLLSYGILADNEGKYELARSLYQESLELAQELGDRRRIAYSLGNLGNVALEQGDYASADPLFKESLRILQWMGDKYTAAAYLAGLAGVTCGQGQPQRAVRLLGAVETLLESIGARMDPSNRARYDHNLAAARSALDEQSFTAALAGGRAMTIDQAIDYALSDGESHGADWAARSGPTGPVIPAPPR